MKNDFYALYSYNPTGDSLRTLNNEAYLFGRTLTAQTVLFKTDGTAAGTVIVKDFTKDNLGIGPIIGSAGNRIYFMMYNYSSRSYELWCTDGSEANTIVIKNDFGYYSYLNTAVVGGTLFFAYSTGLWKTDGTIAGTLLVKTFNQTPHDLTAFKGNLYFGCTDGSMDRLWKSDGTSAGTLKVTNDVNNVANLTSSGGMLFFSATGDPSIYGDIGKELFRTDGSAGGIKLVKDITPGASYANFNHFVSTNSTLFFFVNDNLWKTDATNEGTAFISTTGNGDGQSPRAVVNVDGELYFTKYNSGIMSLYHSNGTSEGTKEVSDDNLAGVLIDGNRLTFAANQLFLSGYSYKYGQELYAGKVITPISYTTAGNGNWSDASIWEGNTVPPRDANVIIRHNIIGNINAECNSLTVEAAGNLNVKTGISIVVLK